MGDRDAGATSSPRTRQPLSMAESPPRERADAARNRLQILAAAEGLFAEADPRTVTMGEIAARAGVGRGTLYRRYPSVTSIAIALLDEHERVLQQRLISGPPPLGPGAPPGRRLAAFFTAMCELLEEHLPLALGAETGSSRFGTGAYGFWRLHVRTLLVEAGAPDADTLADTLLAPLDPDVFCHQRHELGIPVGRIAAALAWQAERLLGGRPA